MSDVPLICVCCAAIAPLGSSFLTWVNYSCWIDVFSNGDFFFCRSTHFLSSKLSFEFHLHREKKYPLSSGPHAIRVSQNKTTSQFSTIRRRHSTTQHGGAGQFLHHRLQKQPTFFHLNSSTKSRSKSMDDFTTGGFLFENGYNKYRPRNGVKLNNGSSLNGSHSISNNMINNSNNNNSSSSPSHSGIHANGLRHYNNNFASNNLNGGHSYGDHLNGGGVTGGKFLSMKNHSVDNLLDVETNYESYYQVFMFVIFLICYIFYEKISHINFNNRGD